MQVGAIHVYPVKGARGLSPAAVAADAAGLAGDRRWMLVEPDGTFVTQREMPALALLDVRPDPDGLHLAMPEGHAAGSDGGERFVARPEEGAARAIVTVWDSEVDAALADEAANAALSRWFARPLRLVYMDASSRREVTRDWAPAGTPVGFADGFPFLVATSESLRGLNQRIVGDGGEAVPMSRFRPNVVIDGVEDGAFAEDGWTRLSVGPLVLDLVKPCARCSVTTVDGDRGVFAGPQPIDARRATRLSGDRRVPGVLFGWNAILSGGGGTLRVGDAVRVLERRPAPWPIARPRSAA